MGQKRAPLRSRNPLLNEQELELALVRVRLRDLLKRGGIAVAELEKLGNLKRTCAQKFMAGGTKDPRGSTVVAFAKVFAVSTDYLLLNEGPAPTDAHLQEAVKAARAKKTVAAGRAKKPLNKARTRGRRVAVPGSRVKSAA